MDKPRSVSLIDGGWLEKARQGLVASAWTGMVLEDRVS
jgi:hypothetical protein